MIWGFNTPQIKLVFEHQGIEGGIRLISLSLAQQPAVKDIPNPRAVA
jgi:hypothetical protein